MHIQLTKSLSLAALGLACSWAHAGLIGTSATVGYHYLGTTYSDSLLVGAGVEVSCPGAFAMCTPLSAPTQTVDLGDTFIAYQYVSTNGQPAGFGSGPAQPSYFVFDDLLTGEDIVGFTLTTDISGLGDSRVSISANSVHVDMWGLDVGFGRQFRIDLITAPSGLPEPATAALAALALAGLSLGRRQAATARRA